MKISKDNQLIIDVLELLLFDNSNIGVKALPYIVFNKEHVNQSNFTIFEIKSVLKKLQLKSYIKSYSTEDYLKDSNGDQQKLAESFFDQAIKLGATPESLVKEIKEKMETAGLRMEGHDFDKIETVFDHPDMKKNINDSFNENLFKSKIIDVYKIMGDLYKLIQDLKDNRDFKSIKANYPDLIYNSRTTELFLLDEDPIQISKYRLTKNQHSKVLKAIFKDGGKDKKHNFFDFMKDRVLPENITSENYYKICDEINRKKVFKATNKRVSDFLLISMDSVQINPKYSKKLHQLTLQIN